MVEVNALVMEDSDDLITLGFSESFLKEISEILFIELPETGTRITKGETLITLETSKEVRIIESPETFTLLERNEYWLGKPERIKKSFSNSPWLIKGKREC